MSMQILIMGLLKDEPRHPYEMKRVMKKQNWDRLFSITDGNLYHNIRKAEERGNIRGSKKEQIEQRPSRTVYELTVQGEEVLAEMITEVFRQQRMDVSLVYPALLFVHYSNRELVEEAVRTWARNLEDIEESSQQYEPPASYIVKHFEERKKVDRRWLLEIADWLDSVND
ncbi:PadR family transcriptional regulator [Salimicrobium flavidum]|uniref:DNA-binding transcriptional regulator, PadR family n=1 Tax=Salimicrobium flavidum TaxID=570947 RepID=A0A1N7ISY9_9BACI|nr:PadR family transcriptional regulator [Salimicrobium flavidum]SIS40081.1 DNA-binding transcriptional regulator, PadR family [Salimicrobium flavidum]